MNFYNRLNNNLDNQIGYSVNITKSETNFKINVFNNQKLSLSYDNINFIWASYSADYWGCWVLKKLNNSVDFFPKFTSKEIDNIYSTLTDSINLTWCKLIAKKLIESGEILNKGKWLIFPLESKNWNYNSPENSKTIKIDIKKFNKIFNQDNPKWISFVKHNNPVLIKSAENENNGRLKFWRKVARENKLPPIILLHISGMSTSILIDGHLRLQASIMENIPPKIIQIYQCKEELYEVDPKIRSKIEQSLEFGLLKNKIDLAKYNSKLTEIYDNRPTQYACNNARVIENENLWNNEVDKLIENSNKTEFHKKMLNKISL